jgi:tetratricopeptide (TPR) repeat protein
MTLSIARLALLFVLLSPISAAALELDSTYLATIREGINLTMVERFAEAKDVFQGLIDRDSTDHAAYLFLAGVYHGEMLDREDYANKPIFYQLIDKALAHAERAIEQNHNAAWAHLTRGNAYSYIAVIEAKNGSWWSALKGGLRAKGEYLDALERDPTLDDAYLGLGSYHYWKSAKTEFINWLPFVPDRKEEAFKELQLAVDSSLFSGDLALNSLVWIHLNAGSPDQAFEIANRLHEKFPDSRLVTWGLAFSAYQCGQLEQAADYFGRILDAIEKQPGQNYYNTIECRYHRACIFRTMNENDKAVKELETLLSYPASDGIRDRQKEKLRRAREMMDQLREQR